MESEPERPEARRQQIGDRITAIRTRIGELQQAQRTGDRPVSSSEHLVHAENHAAVSEAAAQQALTASIDAFERAAEAHERLATHYEHTADLRDGDPEDHRQRAASQRAAAAADHQRAEKARSLLSSRAAGSQQEG